MEAFEPRAFIVDGLSPGCHYAVYVGGVDAKRGSNDCIAVISVVMRSFSLLDCMARYATFHTLPAAAESLHIILSHECRADLAVPPAEADLRHLLESAVAHSTSEVSPSLSPAPVHMTVHLGGFLSVENILKSQAFHMLDILARDDVAPDAWLVVLRDTETMLRAAYRDALNAPAMAVVLRRAGNIFLCGQGEVGGSSVAMLVASRPTDITLGGGGPPVSTVGRSVAQARQRLLSEAEERSAAQEELRELAIAALVRAARRVYWKYLRQTWQEADSFERMIRADASDEEMHRSVCLLPSRHVRSCPN